MNVRSCQNWLASIWFAGFGFLFALLVLRTVFSDMAVVTNELWRWILPNMVPFISLVASGIFVTHRRNTHGPADGYVFYVALLASLLYLMTLLVLMIAATRTENPSGPSVYLNNANFFLAPLQAIDTAALGVFFIKHNKSESTGGE